MTICTVAPEGILDRDLTLSSLILLWHLGFFGNILHSALVRTIIVSHEGE